MGERRLIEGGGLLNLPNRSCVFTIYANKSKGPFTRQKRRNGSGRNEYRFQQTLTVYTRKFCKGTDKKWHGPQRIEERIKTVYTLLFFSRLEPIEPEI